MPKELLKTPVTSQPMSNVRNLGNGPVQGAHANTDTPHVNWTDGDGNHTNIPSEHIDVESNNISQGNTMMIKDRLDKLDLYIKSLQRQYYEMESVIKK